MFFLLGNMGGKPRSFKRFDVVFKLLSLRLALGVTVSKSFQLNHFLRLCCWPRMAFCGFHGDFGGFGVCSFLKSFSQKLSVHMVSFRGLWVSCWAFAPGHLKQTLQNTGAPRAKTNEVGTRSEEVSMFHQANAANNHKDAFEIFLRGRMKPAN